MSSREIAQLTGKRHDNVRGICSTLQIAGVCPEIKETPYKHEQNGQTYYEFWLNKRDSLVLVARLSPEFTATIIDRWQELEAKQQFNIPTTLSGALRLAAAQAEMLEVQTQIIKQQKPAVEFVERYIESSGNKGFRDVCKLLKAKENKFREFLLSEKIMYRLDGNLTPYGNHIDAGRFEVNAGLSETDHAYTQAKFTPKGINWIAGLWAVHNLKG